MKKFVIVMISFLVLFIFLMLNYLLWDKENLLKERDSDKIEQDWLRGQNRTLQTTVEEQEQAIASLEAQNDTQRDKIAELERQARLALERENKNLKDIQEKDQALNDYKSLMDDDLTALTTQWFDFISKNKYEESFNLLDKEFILWGRRYNSDNYIKFISDIGSIAMQEAEKDSEEKPFIILGDGEPYIIKTQIKVNVTLKDPESFKALETGAATLEISFKYDRDTSKWVIMSVDTLKIGKP